MNDSVNNTVKGIAFDFIDLMVKFVEKVFDRTSELVKNESNNISDTLKIKIDKKISKDKT